LIAFISVTASPFQLLSDKYDFWSYLPSPLSRKTFCFYHPSATMIPYFSVSTDLHLLATLPTQLEALALLNDSVHQKDQ